MEEYLKNLAKKYKLEKLADPKHIKTISSSTIIVLLLLCLLITAAYGTMIWLLPELKHTLTLGLFK